MRYLIPLGLYALALIVRLVAATEMPFPTTEPSAYYVGVAQNLVGGEGLVSEAVWSYATEPIEVPKPAFTLWLPMSTFVSAAAMAVAGETFWAAQLGHSILGALVAPLAWAIGREAANAQGLDARRGRAVAITAGLLAAVLSPLVLSTVVPDSFTPFTVFMLGAALLVPRVIGARDGHDDVMPPSIVAGLALGLAMGLAYLSRQEVIWMGLTVLLMQGLVLSWRPNGSRLREAAKRLWPVIVGGLLVVVPWLVRNVVELGTPMSGQAVENMFLVDNEDVFAYSDPPSAATYLAQGATEVLLNPIEAALAGLVDVLLVPPFPVGMAGLLTIVLMWRAPFLRRPTALMATLLSGLLIFASTNLLFPVATLAGTFMHASGALLVGLGVAAAIGGDALLAKISALREWERPNVVIAPIALVSMALLMAAFQVTLFGSQSGQRQEQMGAVGAALERVAAERGTDLPSTIITDHPMWLSQAIDGYAVVLPDEDIASVQELAARFEAPWVVVIDERGRYPDAFLTEDARACLAADPIPLEAADTEVWLVELAPRCGAT
ncbi:MAG: glycosyltransferase family 39 protein [Candidatus Limnocylindrales bacterium]